MGKACADAEAAMMQWPENETWEVRDSGIHGLGMFARRRIKRGEKVLEYLGEKITKAESNRRGLALYEEASKDGSAAVFIFELNKRYDLDGDIPENAAKHINHSCDPNCEAQNIRGHIWVVALRSIAPGEELTFDYGFGIEHFLEHPCRCGAKGCIGYIVRKDQRRRLQRMLRGRSPKQVAAALENEEAG